MTMLGSDYGVYHELLNTLSELCISPSVKELAIVYQIGSTSTFGGLLLMAAQQLSLLLKNRWIDK